MMSETQLTEGRIETTDGLALLTRTWEPSRPSRGQVVVVHGLKDHSQRYDRLARQMAETGLTAHAFDLRGHGGSGGPRAHVGRFEEYLSDLSRFVRDLRSKRPTGPLFLYGHSMGGAITIAYVLSGETRFDGLVLTGAAIDPPSSIGPVARGLTRLLGAVAPRSRIFELKDEAFSRDPETVARLRTDPLVFHGNGTARLASELLRRMRRSRPQLDRLELPLLVLHGSADRLTSPAGSQLLFDQSRSRDKRLTVLPGWYHDLLHEPDHQRVANEITEWLAFRLPDA